MQQKHPNMAHKIATQQHHLAIHDEREARTRQPNRRPEPVPINHRVNERREENRKNLERLWKFQPQKWSEDHYRIVEQLEEWEFSAANNSEKCTQRV